MAKIRILIFLVFALILVIPHSPAIENYFNDWLYNEQNFSVDGNLFIISMPETGFDKTPPSRIILNNNQTKLIIMENDCKEWNSLNICWTESVLGEPLANQFTRFKVHVTAQKIIPNPYIARTLSTENLEIGDLIEIETSFGNSGNIGTNVSFKDFFPENNFILTADYDGCRYFNESLEWSGWLDIDSIKKCRYVFKAKNAINFSSITVLQYTIGNQTKTLSDEKKINIANDSLVVNINYSKKELELFNEADIELKLKSPNEKIRYTNLTINIPEGISVKEPENKLKKNGNTLNWAGITPNEIFVIKVQGLKTGYFELDLLISYEIRNKIEKYVYKVPLNVTIPQPQIVPKITKDTLNEGENGGYKIFLFNPSSKYTFHEIKVDIQGNINHSEQFDYLRQLDSMLIYELNFTAEHTFEVLTKVRLKNSENQSYFINNSFFIYVSEKFVKPNISTEPINKSLNEEVKKTSEEIVQRNIKRVIVMTGFGLLVALILFIFLKRKKN